MTAAKDTLGKLHSAADFSVVAAELYRPAGIAPNFGALSAVAMFLDPAGSGGDEVAFFLNRHHSPPLPADRVVIDLSNASRNVSP